MNLDFIDLIVIGANKILRISLTTPDIKTNIKAIAKNIG